MSFFKACDLRGIEGEDFVLKDIAPIGRALGEMIADRGGDAVCVGGDFRRDTAAIKQRLIDGLIAADLTVRDLGHVPTPVVYFASRHLACPNVAIVTASHNPGRYNGIKFQIAGEPATDALVTELEERAKAPESHGKDGNVIQVDVVDDYAAWIIRESCQLVAHSAVLQSRKPVYSDSGRPARGLRIVLDAMSGACTKLAPKILESAGHTVVSLNDTIDPDFRSGAPNPSDESNLKPLQTAVVEYHANAGIALDGDGDRVVLVDQLGTVVRPEQLAVLLIRSCFSKPTVVYDLKCASIVARAIQAAGGQAIMQPSGYGFIKSAMIRRAGDVGVEASGHHFFGTLGGGDDGLFTALVILDIIRQTGVSLSEWIAPIGWPAITPDLRVPFTGDTSAALASIQAACGGTVSCLDGIRADYDTGWGLARVSITEPAMTFRFEAEERSQLTEIASRFLAGVPAIRSSVLEMIQ